MGTDAPEKGRGPRPSGSGSPGTHTEATQIVPANRASAEDLDAVFGTRGDPSGCRCQWFTQTAAEWRASSDEERAGLLREQTRCGHPRASTTTGLVAYVDGEPAGWVAVRPRSEHPRLARMRVPWEGRDEDRGDPGVWAITCFVVRREYRGSGLGTALAAAAVAFARERGADAVEGYARDPASGTPSAELYVGTPGMFRAAGLTEVARPGPRRVVMRLELRPVSGGGEEATASRDRAG